MVIAVCHHDPVAWHGTDLYYFHSVSEKVGYEAGVMEVIFI
jgi:hypothetical protein